MKRIPEGYEEIEEVMSNFDREVDQEVADQLKSGKYFAPYPGWNFYGRVWWEDEWFCEVWVQGSYDGTYNASTLEELMKDVSDFYGYD